MQITNHTSAPGLTDIVRSENNNSEVVRGRGYSNPGESGLTWVGCVPAMNCMTTNAELCGGTSATNALLSERND